MLLILPSLLLGLVGLLVWTDRIGPRLAPLREEDSSRHGVLLFLLGFLFFQLFPFAVVGSGLLTVEDTGPLGVRMLLQDLANLLAVACVLLVARRLGGGVAALGLRAHEGPGPIRTAVCGWMAVLPLLTVVSLANAWALSELGLGEALQRNLADFLAQPEAHRSPLVWLSMVVIIPMGEELLVRGALYGGLRRTVPPLAAMVLSGLLFGLLHEPSAMLPVAVLGMWLAWLYERTGSLLVPCLAHGLQNGATLLLALAFPEIAS